MKMLSSTVVVHVTDLKSSLDYYTNILGFETDFIYGDYAGLVHSNVCIQLCGPANAGKQKAVGTAHFCIDCDNVGEYYESITSKGAIIDANLEDRNYGVRDCAINDPDGNTIVFSSAITHPSK